MLAIGDQRALAYRAIRFLMTGLLTTALTYLIFVTLISRVHYTLAAFGAWGPVNVIGFLINRRFTFGLVGRTRRNRQFLLYVSGSILQLGISLIGYAFLFDVIHLAPTPAFVINLAATTAFSFTFMNLVTFGRIDRAVRGDAPAKPAAGSSF